MVKTACPKPSFEGYSEILLEHHGRIHLRDSRNLAPPSGPFPVNKGRGWYRSGYIAGEFDGHAGMKQQVMETTTTETRITGEGSYGGYGDEPSTEDPDDCDWVLEDPIVHPRQESQICKSEDKQSLPTPTQSTKCQTRSPMPQRRSQVRCQAKGRLATLP